MDPLLPPTKKTKEELIGKKTTLYPSTLANSTFNYIIFRNVEIFKNYFISNKIIIVKENSEYFRNIPFVEMNVSKLIN